MDAGLDIVEHAFRKPRIPPLLQRFHIVVSVVLLATDICGALGAVAQPCRATATDLQALRDNLEIVRIQIRAARNESGYEKQWPTDTVLAAIRALEAAVGHPIAPSSESGVVRTPRGSTKHPHVEVARQAFGAARRAFDDARCAMPGPTEALQKAMEDLDRALQFR